MSPHTCKTFLSKLAKRDKKKEERRIILLKKEGR